MRTLVIGDIHGALKSLVDVLNECNYDREFDNLIFVGDYVDGWSESAEVVEFLIDLKIQNPNIIFIRGNHDVWCEDFLFKGHQPFIWTQNGGYTTIKSYQDTGLLLESSHRAFFKDLLNWYIDSENRLFIHGGWDYKTAPFPEGALIPVNAASITPSMECHWDRSLLSNAAGIKAPAVIEALGQFKEVYIGHTATHGLPENYHNLWNVDTGAGWSGKLSVMDIDTKEVWQSDYSKVHYPDQKGR